MVWALADLCRVCLQQYQGDGECVYVGEWEPCEWECEEEGLEVEDGLEDRYLVRKRLLQDRGCDLP